ncbi:uncharacterized protein BKA78DRAFT_367547 [Phyllosticta capitalensis]|uniref:uncharacterized protein n=1 Tax=Phyllosticta capitalensis TaxID=121624 RepID=UPI003132886B
MASQHTSVVDPMKSKRRAVASSDEEFEAQIVDETFRIGWPYLQSLPVKFECPNSEEEYGSFVFDLDDALASFHAILASESVDFVAVDLGWQHTIGAKADKTLRVIAQGKSLGKSSVCRRVTYPRRNRRAWIPPTPSDGGGRHCVSGLGFAGTKNHGYSEPKLFALARLVLGLHRKCVIC